MEGLEIILVIFILATASSFAFASDPSPLEDFCVANPEGSVSINGRGSGVHGQPLLKFSAPNVCKGAALVTADDFSFSGLHIRKNTSNSVGSAVTPVNVAQIPGLHTLGISMVRVDYAPNGGLNPPHTHPRASEILVVIEGKLRVGFVTSNPDNRLITKVLYPGDVFVFPEGLIHFQYNIGNTHAVAFAGLNSQNPGVITVANAVFGSNPSISAGVLAKAFKLDGKLVGNLQSNF